MILILHRRADLSPAAFAAYWLDHHAPLVRALAADIGIRGYVQVHLDPSPDQPFDGLAQVLFDSREALQTRLRTTEGRAASRRIVADEGQFLDPSRTVTLWGLRHTII